MNEVIPSIPDLFDPSAWEAWRFVNGQERLSCDEVVALLPLSEPIACWRAAMVLINTNRFEEAKKFLLQAQLTDNLDLDVAAKSASVMINLAEARTTHTNTEFHGARLYIRALLGFLDEVRVRKTKTLFTLEVEMRIHSALSYAYQSTTEYDAVCLHASQTMILAGDLQMSFALGFAELQYTIGMAGQGRISDTVHYIEKILERPALNSRVRLGYEISQAVHTFNLGDYARAAHLLSIAGFHSSHPEAVPCVTHLLGLIAGFTHFNQPILSNYEWYKSYEPLFFALNSLMRGFSLPRLNQHSEERTACFRKAIEFARRDEKIHDPLNEIYKPWIRCVAYYHLGEFGLATSAIANVKHKFPEMLNFRLFVAGAKLELALQLVDIESEPISKIETEIRQVFEDASRTPHASPIGLAQLLQFWHPLAAAYCHLMPNAVGYLDNIGDSILKVRKKAVVYQKDMPPVYARELLIRSLGCDLHDRSRFIQARLNKKEMLQRDKQFGERGKAIYWRPVLTGPQIAFGFMKAFEQTRDSQYRSRAQQVVADYGISIETKTRYANQVINEIENATLLLLSGDLTTQGFRNKIVELNKIDFAV